MTHLATYQASLTDEQRAEIVTKLYTVEISMTVVIRANNYLDAHNVTGRNVQDIVRDIGVGEIIVGEEITLAKDLPKGWSVDLLPYGFDDGMTIGEILNEQL